MHSTGNLGTDNQETLEEAKRGIGVGIGYHGAGGRGYDGLLRITPDGILQIHSGVGNLELIPMHQMRELQQK